jgi:hypothetical protein
MSRLEYWIVRLANKIMFPYILTDGQFINHKPKTFEDTIFSYCIEGFSVPLSKIF